MRHDLELGYLAVELPDPSSLSPFFGETIGLVAGQPTTSGALTWRNDARAHRVILSAGPSGDAGALGFEATDAESFAAHADRLAVAGYRLTDGTAKEIADRQVVDLKHTMSPWGVRIELVHGLGTTGGRLDTPLTPGGYLTDGVGFGHAVFATTELEASHTFVTEGLGMRQSDWVEVEIMAGVVLEVRFYHCNQRHHSLALAGAPFELPQRLHHLMVETVDRDDVGRAFDRVWASGLPIANGLGRHDNDGMFSFYVVSPAGFQVEVGHGARLITDDWDDNHRYDRISQWGHQPLGER
jgi:2,3-dihydroxybiphenyl 1,2-dioxygenase